MSAAISEAVGGMISRIHIYIIEYTQMSGATLMIYPGADTACKVSADHVGGHIRGGRRDDLPDTHIYIIEYTQMSGATLMIYPGADTACKVSADHIGGHIRGGRRYDLPGHKAHYKKKAT